MVCFRNDVEINDFQFPLPVKLTNHVEDYLLQDKSLTKDLYVERPDIFYNDLEITKNVKNVNFKYYTDSNNKQDNTIVTVTVNFENYTKKMNYKIEEIY